jgi:protocatechuate 3,4-dioxygenase beta subunit
MMQKKDLPQSARAAVILLALAAAAGLIAVAVVFLFPDETGPDDFLGSEGGAAKEGISERDLIAGAGEDDSTRRKIERAGAGETVRVEGFISLDSAPLSGVTILAYRDYSRPLPPNVVNALRASPFIYSEAGTDLRQLLDEAKEAGAEPTASCLTNPDGSFTIDVTASESVFFSLDHDFFFLPDEQAGPYNLTDGAAGITLESFDGALDARLGGMVRGFVKDSGGFPIEKAAVELLQLQTGRAGGGRGFPFGGGGSSLPARISVTDREGSFTLRGIPPTQGLLVQAHADSRATARSDRFDATAGQVVSVEIALRDGAAITALVRGPDGAPLEDAEVFLEKKIDNDEAENLGGFSRIMRMLGPMAAGAEKSDGEGAVHFGALGPGEYSLRAAYPGMLETTTKNPLVIVEEDRSHSAELLLQWGHSITGRVLDEEDRPVAGAVVRARVETNRRGGFDFRNVQRTMTATPASAKEALSASDGVFTITGLEPESSYDLAAEAGGFVTARKNSVAVGDEEPTIVMARPGQIEGRVVALAGSQPVKSFVVRIAPILQDDGSDRGGMRGGFGGRGPRPDRGRERGGGRGGNRGGNRGGGPFGGGGESGRADATNRIFESIGQVFRNSFARPEGATDREDECHNNDGRFSLGDILPGKYRLCVSASRYAPGITGPLTVEKGTTLRDIVVALGPGGTIAGRVIDPNGPVTKATVTIRTEKDPDAEMILALDSVSDCRSEARGEFQLDNLPGGRFILKATHPDHPEAVSDTLILSEGGRLSDIVIVLPAGGTIAGTAFDAQGRPLESERVLCSVGRDWSGMRRDRTDSEGRFEFKGLAEGTYSVRLMSGGGGMFGGSRPGPDSLEVPIAEGEIKEVTLQEAPLTGATVQGTITDRGVPIDNGFLMATPGNRGQMRTAIINQDGTYRIDGIAPGSNRFTIRYSGDGVFENTSLTFDIPDLQEVTLDIAVPCGSISGTVIDAATNRPIEGVRLSLRSSDEDERGGRGMMGRWGGGGGSDRSDEEGAFSFNKLTAGVYTIEARPSSSTPDPLGTGYRAAEMEGVAITEGQLLDGLSLTLSTGGGIRVVALDSNRDPVRGAQVTATRIVAESESGGGRPSRGRPSRGRTNDAGETTLTGLEPGTWSLTVQARNMGQEAVEAIQVIEGRLQDVSVTLEAGFELSVRLVDDGGATIENARITLHDSRGRSLGVPSARRRGASGAGEEGETNVYSLGTLLPDSYTLQARWSGKTGTGSFSAGGAGTVDVVIQQNK